jgi:uncharacterized protein (UPF0332 family)
VNRTANTLLDKARENVQVARKPIEDQHIAVAVSRAYYALFYTAEALLAAEGMSFAKHSAVIAAFGQHFAKPRRLDPEFHRYLRVAFAMRGEADYALEFRCSPAEAREVVAWADEFISAAVTLLGES